MSDEWTNADKQELINDLTDEDFAGTEPLWLTYLAEKLLDVGWRKSEGQINDSSRAYK